VKRRAFHLNRIAKRTVAARATVEVAGFFNSDQGSQFTGADCIRRLARPPASQFPSAASAVEGGGMRVSHDGRGPALDHVMIERLCRSVKSEDLSLHADETLPPGPCRAGVLIPLPQ
jgi:hypothetical protein